MLSRISSALLRSLTPLTSSFTGQKEKHHEQRQNPQPDRQETKSVEVPSNVLPFAPLFEQKMSPTRASNEFIHILDIIQEHRRNIVRWIGQRAYLRNLKQSPKSTKASRGVIIDVKA